MTNHSTAITAGLRLACVALACATVLARPAGAQDQPTAGSAPPRVAGPTTQAGARPQPASAATVPAREPALSLQGFGTFAYTSFTASETFDAVLDTSSGWAYGGGVRVSHRSGLFFQADLSRFSDTGERVFVFRDQVIKLGIPLEMSVTPFELSGGYRFVPRRRAAPRGAGAPRSQPRFIPYGGGGIGFVQYKEESPFAEAGENVSESFTSYHVLGGIDVPLTRWFGTGVEVNYRWVPDALGEAGASEAFGETDLGGLSVRLRVTVGR